MTFLFFPFSTAARGGEHIVVPTKMFLLTAAKGIGFYYLDVLNLPGI